MGQKVNYNKNKSNKLKIISIVILILVILVILIKSIIDVTKSMKNQVNTPITNEAHALVKDYQSLESLLLTCDCKVLSKEETNEKLTAYVSFGKKLYDGNTSNEKYFWNIAGLVANYIDYKDFELIDKSKNIDIKVTCEKPYITSYVINDDENYYLNHDSEKNAKKVKESTLNISVQSQVLQTLIDNNWDETKVSFGTKESQFMDYDVYFEEGMKVRVVSRNIFNVVYTNKYIGSVAGGLTPTSTKEEVKAALGNPLYADESSYYGYRAEKFYVFFDFLNSQISVYPIVEVSEDEEKELVGLIEKMNQTQDIKRFVTDLTGMWLDYDLYEYDSNFVKLKYTLKGVELNIYSDSLKNGVFLYQNYSGDRKIDSNEKVYIKSTNSIADTEYARIMTESQKTYGAILQDNPESDAYIVELINSGEYGIIKVRFISKDGTKPDIEISEEMDTLAWFSDTELIYSIQNKGIYYYNLETGTKQELLSGEEDYNITSFENGILYYDDTTLAIN